MKPATQQTGSRAGWVPRLMLHMMRTYRMPDAHWTALRVIIALYYGLSMMPPNLTPLTSLPDALFQPPLGFMRLLHGFPSEGLAIALLVASYVAIAALLVGVAVRLAGIGLTLLLVLGYGFQFSTGKVDSNIVELLLPLVLAFGAGRQRDLENSNNGRRVRFQPAVFVWAWVVASLLVTAALPKLIGGWLDPSVSATRQYFLHTYHEIHRTAFLQPLALRLDIPVVWKGLDYFTLLAEGIFLIAPFRRRWMQWGSMLMMCLHVGILLVLNIPSVGFFLAYAVFFDLSGCFPKRLVALATGYQRRPALLQIGWVLGVAALLGGLGYGYHAIQQASADPTQFRLHAALLAEGVGLLFALSWAGRQLGTRLHLKRGLTSR